MSPASSGNKSPEHTYVHSVEDSSHVGEVRRFAMNLALSLKFDEVCSARVGIVISELGTNLAKYAAQGKLLIQRYENGLEILH